MVFRGLDYNELEVLNTVLTSDEIASKIAIDDDTKGSCVSAAFAYIGNKAGYDVSDFRGGRSRSLFSKLGTINKIMKLDGVKGETVSHVNDLRAVDKLLRTTNDGKEYFLGTGKHAAIIRRIDGKFEYLELQSEDCGFKKLTNKVLKERFDCKEKNNLLGIKFEKPSVLIDVESLSKNDEFIKMLGYINNP